MDYGPPIKELDGKKSVTLFFLIKHILIMFYKYIYFFFLSLYYSKKLYKTIVKFFQVVN